VDSTESYRASYYNSSEERTATAAALDEHRDRALRVLTGILSAG
jgi:hypothetical protein